MMVQEIKAKEPSAKRKLTKTFNIHRICSCKLHQNVEERFICWQDEKKLKGANMISSPAPMTYRYTGVSQGNRIQNWFVVKQHFFVPNKRLALPTRGQKKSFFSSPEIGSWRCIMLGGPGSQVCSSWIRQFVLLQREPAWWGRGVPAESLQNGTGGDVAKHLFCLGSHAQTLFKTS